MNGEIVLELIHAVAIDLSADQRGIKCRVRTGPPGRDDVSVVSCVRRFRLGRK